MSLIICKINLILTWSANCVISEGNRVTVFGIQIKELYIPVAKRSNQGNAKLLQELR